MTTDLVPFKAEIKFNPTSSSQGTLVFEKDNPSGLPENAKQIEIPIRFKSTETTKVKVFFNNDRLDPEFSCYKVFPIEREIKKIPKSPEATGIPAPRSADRDGGLENLATEDLGTQAIARAAIEELLKGATETEKANGFFTSINEGVKIQKLTIENGVAKIDFDQQIEFQVGGSCRVSAIRAQITETLKQFPTVKEVIISVNDRTEDILQP